ncbi:MAG: 8-amino-7-oxononanoate synthase, partial [Thermodesulfobacteriota bacterium]
MTDFYDHLSVQLDQLDRQGLRRALVDVTGTGQGRLLAPSGRPCLNLSGNDYLGLAGNRELVAELYRGIDERTLLERFAPGATASRLMSGNSVLYTVLERKIANLYGSETCLVFNSGYHGNTGILPALA